MIKTSIYRLTDGTSKEFTYEDQDPCMICGLPVIHASMSGTNICAWCDCGNNRDGTKVSMDEWNQRNKRVKAYIEVYKALVDFVVVP